MWEAGGTAAGLKTLGEPHKNADDNNKKTGDRRHKPSALITDYSLSHERYSCLRLELHAAQCNPMPELPEERRGLRIVFAPSFFCVERRSEEAAARI